MSWNSERIRDALRAGSPRELDVITSVMGDRDAHGLATALNAIIESGGWKVKEGTVQAVFSKPVDGVVIVVASRPPPDAANELFRALKMGGIIATGRLVREQKPGRVSLWVGSRPGGDSSRGHRV
jgi:hypothetical protein